MHTILSTCLVLMEADDEQRRLYVRKLRKKLRQIENLEQVNRPLNEDEREKVLQKKEIRTELLELLEAEDEEEVETGRYEETKSEDNILIDFTTNVSELETCEPQESDNEETQVCFIDVPNIPPVPQLSPKKVNVFYEEENAVPKKTADKARQKEKSATPLKNEKASINWNKQIFQVRILKGHNDIINSVTADKDLILSCSRDTTVKVWDATTGEEINSLRGHTSSVTCVVLLSESDSAELARYLRYTEKCRIAISGGVDCNVKVWSIAEGKELKSIYVYNGISSVAYLPSEVCILTGAEGGKLELWDAVSSQNLVSLHTDDDIIPHIKLVNQYVYTTAPDGVITVWEVLDRDIKLIFSSEKISYGPSNQSVPRKIRSMEVVGEDIYYGDDGVNVKVLNWKSGIVKKFTNHTCEFGATDAIAFTGSEVICSSYDLDTGYGTMNVHKRSKNGHTYVTSLGDGGSGRIMCIACTYLPSGEIRIVTAGTELKIWDAVNIKDRKKSSETDAVYIKTVYVPEYEASLQDSDLESSESESQSDCSEADFGLGERTYIPKEIGANSNQRRWWCTIL